MRSLSTILCLLFFIGSIPLVSQIKNGSFENVDGTPSLEGWTSVCSNGITSVEEAPPGGGIWSASIPAGNTQGCLIPFVYQPIVGAVDGEIWEVEATVRVDSATTSVLPHTIGLGLAVYPSNRFDIRSWSSTTISTTSTDWVRLTYRDTASLGSQDSLVVVLNPGLTPGPLFANAYFDNVAVRKVGTVSSVEDETHETRPITVSPNPLRVTTIVDLQNDKGEIYSLSLYNSRGEMLRDIGIIKSKSYILERNDLPQGLYVLRVHKNDDFTTSITIIVQ